MKKADKRGFELAISTLVVIVLGMLVLLALVLALTGGFGKFFHFHGFYDAGRPRVGERLL